MKTYSVAFALLLVGLLPTLAAKGPGASTNDLLPQLMTTWKGNVDNIQNHEMRERVQTRLNHIAGLVHDVSRRGGREGDLKGSQALNADVERVETGKVSRCAVFDARTGSPRSLEYRIFEDELRQREDRGLGYEIVFADEGVPALFWQRDGKETLTFYPSGSLKTYLLNIAGDRWYVVRWDERGAIVSEKTKLENRVIGKGQEGK